MIARKRPDISWADLAAGLMACLQSPDEQNRNFCDGESLICLSVRSGFDLLLSTLDLPPGSEVLVSAITIPAMPVIIARHGLVPVPVDMSPESLSVSAQALEAACTPRTRAVLVAHLFGSIMEMDPILAFARSRNLLVIEDCAQAFAGPDYKGNSGSDVRMFSFGPIKTATAIGGGVLFVREGALREKMRVRQAGYPLQSQVGYFRRLLMFSLFKLLLAPIPYAVVVGVFRVLGKSHDDVVTGAGRSFQSGDFFEKIRHRPCAALRWMVGRCSGNYTQSALEQRTRAGRQVLSRLPSDAAPGQKALRHTFWLFPVFCAAREEFQRACWDAGFDAALGATSLCAVEPPADRPEMRPHSAAAMMAGVIYLPVYAEVPEHRREELARLILSLGGCSKSSR